MFLQEVLVMPMLLLSSSFLLAGVREWGVHAADSMELPTPFPTC